VETQRERGDIEWELFTKKIIRGEGKFFFVKAMSDPEGEAQ